MPNTFQTLMIRDLSIQQKFQARSRLNDQVIKDYEALIFDKVAMPSIRVVKHDKELIVVDGFHRLHAYRNKGRDQIEAEVSEGCPKTALKLAIGANHEHGLRRSKEDKARAVEMALTDLDLRVESDRRLGELCGVSHTFIASIREKTGVSKPKSKFARKKPALATREVESTPPPEFEDEPEFDRVAELFDLQATEITRLKDQIAMGLANGTDEEKALVQLTIDELREELRISKIELESVKGSRNRFQQENHELKRQCERQQKQIKQLNGQLKNYGFAHGESEAP